MIPKEIKYNLQYKDMLKAIGLICDNRNRSVAYPIDSITDTYTPKDGNLQMCEICRTMSSKQGKFDDNFR